jgi:curved DNA-binding protein CbpA
MKNERRSLYRVLHVQPEAPAEIIAAAYRCLMTKLRHHPDLGGDHDTAVKINEAYAVLNNPARRKAYDQLRRQKRPVAGGAPQASPAAASERCCPFCGAGIPRIIATGTRCNDCDSPLAPIAHSLGNQHEVAGRRGASRVNRNEAAMIYLAHGRRPSTARLRDLSPTGISLFTGAAVAVGANVRIVAPGADLIAHVVQVRMRDRIQLVHARLLTAHFAGQPGVFVSVHA